VTETPVFDPIVRSVLSGSLPINFPAWVMVRFQFHIRDGHTSVLKPGVLSDAVRSFLHFFKINAEILGLGKLDSLPSTPFQFESHNDYFMIQHRIIFSAGMLSLNVGRSAIVS
jgi:hypothetical protein